MSARIILLTHADSDLAALSHGLRLLPEGFPSVRGVSLQAICDTRAMSALLTELAEARVVIVRVLGRLSGIAGWQALVGSAAARGQSLLVVSGTGEPNPELDVVSTVAPAILRETLAYLQAGGAQNLAQWLRFVSDHLLLSGYGFEAPIAWPEHGIYQPNCPAAPADAPVVGIAFYRAHRLSGNLRFIDALAEALGRRGLRTLAVYTSSLRALNEEGKSAALALFTGGGVDALINTTSFAVGAINPAGPTPAGWSVEAMAELDVPVFQAVTSGMELEQWQASTRGLNPLDTAMNVVIPEFDGRIVTVPVSFKEKRRSGGLEVIEYGPLADRIERVAGIVAAQVRLRRLPPSRRRIAFVFTNSNAKAAQIGNAVGLDAPASLLAVLHALRAAGYGIDDLPESGTALIHALIDRGTYDLEHLTAAQCAAALAKVPAARYSQWFDELPASLRERMRAQWGPPPGTAYTHAGQLILAGLDLGNAVVVLQPPRGYGMDPDAIYHRPDLPPTHHYYALYRWLRDEWGAHAVVHVGKHGTLEWLPGKGVGLGEDCFPDAVLGDLPLFYPFILNDPGEGAQAKRRAHAVIVDHLTPPMTTADTYGLLAQLGELVDEYYQVEMLDPAKLPLLQAQIWERVREARLDRDLAAIVGHGDDDHDHDHGDHDHGEGHEHRHRWDERLNEHGVPLGLARMDGVDFAHLIEDIDGYLCEIGAAQIRDGLHVLGQVPQGSQLVDMLCALTRLPNIGVPSLPAAVARHFGLDWSELLAAKGRRLNAAPAALAQLAGRQLATHSDAMEAIEQQCRMLFGALQQRGFAAEAVEEVIAACLGGGAAPITQLASVLEFACRELVVNLTRTREEIDNLLRGLDGRYVPAGPSGAPTRGMAHILPTGRNFYSVDPRALPSQAAWRVGQELAREVLQRYLKETGKYPESVSISVWGTSAMRTHGDDAAEILALLGVRPLWQAESRRLTGVEVIPLAELGRPRIDVTTRISGFFRDAFPQLIHLIDQAVNAVIGLDEPAEMNFVRKHYLAELAARVAAGEEPAQVERSARYRVFGAKPGTYGAGILPLITERNWQDEADFAAAYVNWGGYAYTEEVAGVDARPQFRRRLTSVEVALHNQDNREHDIFDSDDYLQFHGGMIATIRSLTGRKPRHYFGDTQNPDRAAVRDLKEEALRVFRARVVNPKWLESIRRHGYKGALECTATVDYLFGFDATASIMEDWMYEDVARQYALDPVMREFFEESNPWALHAVAERLLEAAQRGMWESPDQRTLADLKSIYLETETQLEARSEEVPHVQ